MLLSTAVGIFLGFWSVLYLCDFYFRSRSFASYVQFVERTGIVVSPFQVRWYTSHFQSAVHSWDFLKRPFVKRLLSLWFSIGVYFSVCASLAMMILLTKLFSNEMIALNSWRTTSATGVRWTTPTDDISTSSGLIPVVPGVNLPWEQLPFFLLVLILAGVVHELGHAIAAVNENVAVNGFGVFLLVIYPGAFTEIENDSLDAVSIFKKLRIYCAGIWNNFVLASFGLLLLFSIPHLFSGLYLIDKGVFVTDVASGSGLTGPAGLRAGHVVYGVNYCKVYNERSWHSCLRRMSRSRYGYCVSRKEVDLNRSRRLFNVYGELRCCPTNSTQTHLCFYYKTLTDGRMDNLFDYTCLPARYVTDHYVCNTSLPCSPRTVCIYPALFNSTKLLRFFIANQSTPVLFVGYPSEVLSSTTVSDFVPTIRWLPPFIPSNLQLFSKYLITFSIALALLNAVPCYSLDGQFIMGCVLDGLFVYHRKWSRRKRMLLYKIVMYYGTLLLILNITVALFKFFKPFLSFKK